MQLNEDAFRLVAPFVRRPEIIGAVRHDRGGVTLLDCGVAAAGGNEAGLAMARAALAARGDVGLESAAALAGAWPACPWPVVTTASSAPVAACLASQYAGWKVADAGFFAMASGPVRAAIAREPLYDHIGHRERPEHAVGVLETSRLPPPEVCLRLAADAGVRPDRLVLLAARSASAAGTLQVVARSLETALHKLHDLGFDLGRIRRGHGAAPLPPVPNDDLVAIGRTNDAILYGGHVVLEVTGDDASLAALGPRAVSAGSPAHGEPFLRIFERAGRDFYAVDPALFAPAVLELVNVETGARHRFGRPLPEVVARSFSSIHDTGR